MYASDMVSGKCMLEGFTDFDTSGDVDSNRSTSGYVMTYVGGVVSWQSRLQKVVSLSTTEAEYMATVEVLGTRPSMRKQEQHFV